MIRQFATVGGLTLLSRVTGFVRDVVMAAVLGAGPVADAFLIAFRLPNHFRAIFAEGAFSAAFVPAYARVRTQGGPPAARIFGDTIFTLLVASQVLVLGIALVFAPQVVGLLAPGLDQDATRYPLAVEFTRVTFPYLLMMTLVTLYSGILNTLDRFATAAAAPILLNMSLVAALLLATFFPTAGHAAAWGVFAAGCLEAALVATDTRRAGALPAFRWPRFDPDVRRFFRALGPAIVGSAGVQLSLFADTLIASFLPVGAMSALYYADRLNQLPIGVIGIAVGTVLLPDMARRIADGDEHGARTAQNRAFELGLVLALPCLVAFLVVPDLIMRALFARGAFTVADASAAAATLMAYTVGLVPFVLMRSAVATFLARGDTATPVKAALIAAAVNIGLKFALMGPMAQAGLALATAIGGWINLALVLWLAARAGLIDADRRLRQSLVKLAAAGVVFGAALFGAQAAARALIGPSVPLRDELTLLAIALAAAAAYGGILLVLFGRDWFAVFLQNPARSRPAPGQLPSGESGAG